MRDIDLEKRCATCAALPYNVVGSGPSAGASRSRSGQPLAQTHTTQVPAATDAAARPALPGQRLDGHRANVGVRAQRLRVPIRRGSQALREGDGSGRITTRGSLSLSRVRVAHTESC